MPEGECPKQRVILCGLGQVGWLVLDLLRKTGWNVVAVDDRCDPADPRLEGIQVVKGDCRLLPTLEAAGLASANALLALTSNDLVNLTTTLTARSVRPDLRVVARFFNQNIIGRLEQAVPNIFAVSKSALTAPLFALTALSGETLGAFDVGPARREIAELRVGPDSLLRSCRLGSLASRHGVAVLAHEASAVSPAGSTAFLTEIDPDLPLQAGDRIVVCGRPDDVSKMVGLAHGEADAGLRWANLFWRLGRVLYRAFAEIDLPVKLVLSVFLGVLILSAIVFHFAFHWGWVEGVYRTVSVMATAADMKADRDQEELKLYIVFLRLVGIILTAALTALLTNYLVRARLGGALLASRIPDSGHLVVCGLGNIGLRIVEELRRLGSPVVVIEKSASNPHLAAARSQKAIVLIGDACQKETLGRAHASRAKAVIAATSNDLVNVEIALLARDLNPKQRVVLRLDDPLLADAMRTVAPIRHALAVSALAAPAIVAALYSERILCLFTCRQRLMVALELVATAEGTPHLIGQVVRVASVDGGFVPIHLDPAGRRTETVDLMSHRIQVGDRLTLILPLTELERLLRPKPAARDFSVVVEGFPLPMKEWLAQLYRTLNETDSAAAQAAVEQLPLTLKAGLSRGEADALVAQLRREKVAARRVEAAAPSTE